MWDWERKRYSGYGSSGRGIQVKNELERRIRTPRDQDKRQSYFCTTQCFYKKTLSSCWIVLCLFSIFFFFTYLLFCGLRSQKCRYIPQNLSLFYTHIMTDYFILNQRCKADSDCKKNFCCAFGKRCAPKLFKYFTCNLEVRNNLRLYVGVTGGR